MTLTEILQALNAEVDKLVAGKAGEDARKALTDVTAGLPQTVRQALFDDGHATATRASEARLKVIEAEKKTISDQLETFKTDLEKERKGKPDAEAIRREYEQKLLDAEARRKQEVDTITGELHTTRLGTTRDQVMATLLAKGVDPIIARYTVQELVDQGRIKIQDGKPAVYSKDGATPLAPPAGRKPEEVLAEEVFSTIDPRYKRSSAGAGAGEGYGGGTGESAAFFETLRKEAAGAASGEDPFKAILGI